MAGGWQRGFLIVHGVENRRPVGHWNRWLADELRARGEQVWYPQLPDTDRPTVDGWLEVIDAELSMIGDGERIVVCHSLGCLAWLHYALRPSPERVDRVLMVAPPCRSAFDWDAIAPFSPAALDLTRLRGGVPTRLVASDNDPYCPDLATKVYGEPLGCEVDLVPGDGHLALDDGYGAWPAVLDWCLDPAVRITAR
jgi:predicted alpha/beta hydrolase family esterase